MSRSAWIAILVVLILIIGGWYLTRPKAAPSPTPSITETTAPTSSPTASASEGAMVKGKNVVTINSSGFSPQSISIKVGETVTWMNQDTVDHTVNSAVHPTHLVYPPLNLGVIKPGDQKSLTFPTAGTFKYHDHLNPSLFGSVTVQ